MPKKKIKRLTWAEKQALYSKRLTKTNAGAGWSERRERDGVKEYDKSFLETYDDEWKPMHA